MPEYPYVVSVLKEDKTVNKSKATPPSSDEENKQVSVDVRTILNAGHPVIADVQTIENSLQQ